MLGAQESAGQTPSTGSLLFSWTVSDGGYPGSQTALCSPHSSQLRTSPGSFSVHSIWWHLLLQPRGPLMTRSLRATPCAPTPPTSTLEALASPALMSSAFSCRAALRTDSRLWPVNSIRPCFLYSPSAPHTACCFVQWLSATQSTLLWLLCSVTTTNTTANAVAGSDTRSIGLPGPGLTGQHAAADVLASSTGGRCAVLACMTRCTRSDGCVDVRPAVCLAGPWTWANGMVLDSTWFCVWT